MDKTANMVTIFKDIPEKDVNWPKWNGILQLNNYSSKSLATAAINLIHLATRGKNSLGQKEIVITFGGFYRNTSAEAEGKLIAENHAETRAFGSRSTHKHLQVPITNRVP